MHVHGSCEECGTRLYRAGESAPAGAYVRVDDLSFQPLRLPTGGPLPASFDGHIAVYRMAAAPCACERSHATMTVVPDSAERRSEAD